MTEDANTQKTPAKKPLSRKRLLIEVGLVFGASLLLTRGFTDIAGVWPPLGEHLFTLVAAVFLLLPYGVLTWRREQLGDHAMTWKGAVRGIGLALALSVMTLVPFFVGFHMWRTTGFGAQFNPSASNYLRTPIETEGRPELGRQFGAEVLVWREHRDIQMQWRPPPGQHTVKIELRNRTGTVEMLTGHQFAEDPEVKRRRAKRARVILATTSSRETASNASFRIHGPGTLDIRVTDNGRLVTGERLKLGPGRIPAKSFDGYVAADKSLHLARGWWWLPLVVLAQFLLVAFPEEFFYRGYLQTRLERAWPGRVGKGWIYLSVAIVVTSAAFALGHFAVDVRVTRLAVFFPSLLFGLLKDRSGTIVSPIVYHAICNLMVEAVSPHYM